MASLKDIIDAQIANAFNVVEKGQLTEKVTFRYLSSTGNMSVEDDTNGEVYEEIPNITVVVAKPTFKDVTEQNVVFTDTKLIVQGKDLPRDLEVDTDQVERVSGMWNVSKTVGVPGRGIFLVFINQT